VHVKKVYDAPPVVAVVVQAAQFGIPESVVPVFVHERQAPEFKTYVAAQAVQVRAAAETVHVVHAVENPVAEAKPTPVAHEAHNPVAAI